MGLPPSVVAIHLAIQPQAPAPYRTTQQLIEIAGGVREIMYRPCTAPPRGTARSPLEPPEGQVNPFVAGEAQARSNVERLWNLFVGTGPNKT